jgi:hypothetical protein
MTLYSPFDTSHLPMLHPLLYTSPRLTPLRPYSNAVLARLLHPHINYGHPTPRWFVRPSNASLNRQPDANGNYRTAKDPADQQTTKEKQDVMDSDPRMVFGETEFKTVREKYKMPKHVLSSLQLNPDN